MNLIRIQKYLSQQGILSRRKAEQYIKNSWVLLNGTPVTLLGTKIDPNKDCVTLTNHAKEDIDKTVCIAFHKPRGVICNCPQNGETEIKDLLPSQLKGLSTIGRLDKDSEGLILLTNNGTIASHYLNPKNTHIRIYLVWVHEPIDSKELLDLEKGVLLLGKKTKPLSIVALSKTHFRITMIEGKNRQIRRMFKLKNRIVTRLKRIQFSNFSLGSLPPKQWRLLKNNITGGINPLDRNI